MRPGGVLALWLHIARVRGIVAEYKRRPMHVGLLVLLVVVRCACRVGALTRASLTMCVRDRMPWLLVMRGGSRLKNLIWMYRYARYALGMIIDQ